MLDMIGPLVSLGTESVSFFFLSQGEAGLASTQTTSDSTPSLPTDPDLVTRDLGGNSTRNLSMNQ